MKTRFRRVVVSVVITFVIYLSAFVVIHRSYTLRRPAANLAYWYYSDNRCIEAVEFYGFWPLRQIGYHFPGFESRHTHERTPLPLAEDL